MNTELAKWCGRTGYQLMPDRFFKLDENLKAIPGRSIKAWNDRMPNWWPDRDGEYRNDYYYCGNIRGIESKLIYIKNLGFDLIYLTPIEESHSYHHYNPANHMQIDQWLGSWDDFRRMCEKAHELGILIVVDLVFNHTGIRSIYFDNPKYSQWYKKDENGNPVFWWDFKDLPECNLLNPNYQQTMVRVTEKYLEMGADGIRLDLGENLPKEFLEAIGSVKQKYPETIIFGEMWGIATDRGLDSKIFDGQLDSVMNYPIADAILRWTRWGNAEHFRYNYQRVYSEYPINVQNLLLNNIGTHDTPTTMTMLVGDKMNPDVFSRRIWDIEADWNTQNGFDTFGFRKYEAEHDEIAGDMYELGKALTKVAIAILYIIPGIPCIYQGTEIADYGYKDPFNRKPYNWEKEENDMKSFVSEIGRMRRENQDILSEGESRIVRIDPSVIILERFTREGKHLYLAVNRTSSWQGIVLPHYGNMQKQIVKTNGSTMENLAPYGIFIARE